MSEARRLCPTAVVVPPRFDRYAELSQRFRGVLLDQSPLVEPMSIDEAFVDVTGSQRLLGSGADIAERIRVRTRGELGVTVSVGVAASKFVAKIASDMHKPDGCTVIEPGTEPARRRRTGAQRGAEGSAARLSDPVATPLAGDAIGRHAADLARGRCAA